jgi:tetratricopeptide (TPR) repeat protein
VIGAGIGELTAIAQVYLSEMWHEEGRDREAAQALVDVVALVEKKTVENLDFIGRSLGELRARQHYFQACHWESQKDLAKQASELDEALKQYPGEVDVLIACYRLPDRPPEYRRKIVGLVQKAAAQMHKEIENDAEDPNGYNQYAWLIGNTEGDRDEALRCAQKAVELDADNGAYLDTLAHVYAGRGDYASAVKHQARAVEMEPHSNLIVRELKVFQDKLKETPNR